MDRRGFLAGILAACAAPAIVRAGSLMRVNPEILIPIYFGNQATPCAFVRPSDLAAWELRMQAIKIYPLPNVFDCG
jgi:hypothetical protein